MRWPTQGASAMSDEWRVVNYSGWYAAIASLQPSFASRPASHSLGPREAAEHPRPLEPKGRRQRLEGLLTMRMRDLMRKC